MDAKLEAKDERVPVLGVGIVLEAGVDIDKGVEGRRTGSLNIIYIVDFNNSFLSNRACALTNLVVKPYLLCKHNTHDLEEPERTWRIGDYAFLLLLVTPKLFTSEVHTNIQPSI